MLINLLQVHLESHSWCYHVTSEISPDIYSQVLTCFPATPWKHGGRTWDKPLLRIEENVAPAE